MKIRDGERIILTNSKFRMTDYPNFQMKSGKKNKKKDGKQMKFGKKKYKIVFRCLNLFNKLSE